MFRTLSTILGIMLVVTACGETMKNASLQTPPPAPPPPSKMWMVFFDTNSATISDQGNATVSAATNVAKSMPNSKVVVTGFTDTEGSVAYNQALSVRRANSVRDALVRNGISPQSVSVSGAGEQGLLVPTADQTKYPSNRRVQIVVQ